MENGKIDSAFALVAEEVQGAIENLNAEGAQAFQDANYETARLLMDKGPKLLELQAGFNRIWQEWNELMGGKGAAAHSASRVQELDEQPDEDELDRAQNGGSDGQGTAAPDMKQPDPGAEEPVSRLTKVPALQESHTKEQEFLMPILQALVSSGGADTPAAVVEQVEEIMQSRLNEYDHLTLESDPDTIRWQHSVQWASAALIQQGLMRSSGNEWEVTATGKHWLAKQFATT